MNATHWKCCAHFVALDEKCDRCGYGPPPEIDECKCGKDKFALSDECVECTAKTLESYDLGVLVENFGSIDSPYNDSHVVAYVHMILSDLQERVMTQAELAKHLNAKYDQEHKEADRFRGEKDLANEERCRGRAEAYAASAGMVERIDS